MVLGAQKFLLTCNIGSQIRPLALAAVLSVFGRPVHKFDWHFPDIRNWVLVSLQLIVQLDIQQCQIIYFLLHDPCVLYPLLTVLLQQMKFLLITLFE